MADEPKPIDEEWAQLRTLLLSPEQSRLDELRERLDNPVIHARDVSRVLPDALAIRGRSDERLATALAPYVEEGFASSVRKSPRTIVDAIAPIMGPAIRQAIVRTLQGMIQSLNQTLEQSVSTRGVRWRLEAWRTGRPFAEVVLLHTLRYRVEQVFLIHRETGLLLHHVAVDEAAVRDQQLVGGMLTAIQRFVQDSFGAPRDEPLHQFMVGDWTVWIEQGSHALLAGVIRGTPPASVRQTLQDALDQIHAQHGEALVRFRGDAGPFANTQAALQACLQSQFNENRPVHSRPSRALWALGIAALSGLAFLSWHAYRSHQQWSRVVDRLNDEPGIVITRAESRLRDYRLEGLRDPLSRDPADVMREAGMNPSTVATKWSPYYSLDQPIISARAKSILQPPDTVTLSFDGDALVATGSAPAEWAKDASRLALLVPGIRQYRAASLRSYSIESLTGQLERTVFRFASGSSTLDSGGQAAAAAASAAIRDLDALVSRSGQRLSIEILGSADETGPETMNLLLSDARARAVLEALGGKRIGTATTLITGLDPQGLKRRRGTSRDSAAERTASLHVRFLSQDPSQAARP